MGGHKTKTEVDGHGGALGSLKRILVRFWPQIRSQMGLIVGASVALVGQTIFRTLEPWPLKFVFDRVIRETPKNSDSWFSTVDPAYLLPMCALALVVIASLRALSSYLSTVGLALAGNRILTSVRGEMFSHLQSLSLGFHDKARTGDLLTRVVGDIGRLQEVSVTAMLPLVANTLTFVVMFVVMFTMNWKLALVALMTVPLFLVSTRVLGGRIRSAARKQRKQEGAMGATAAEALGAIRVVQSLSLESIQSKAFQKENAASLKEGVRTRRLSARLERTVDVIVSIAHAGVLWYGATLVLAQELSVGDLIVFLAYLRSALKPMRDLAKYTGRIAKALASGERVVEILNTEPEVEDAPDAVPAPATIGELVFHNLSYSYVQGVYAIRDVSLELRKGEVVWLRGDSGAGKSTLISLLLRLHDPCQGRVEIDGEDIRKYTVRSYRSLVSLVPQDVVLFGVSVVENIAYGNPSATPEQIQEAAQIARADSFIRELPEGYETVLGERGATLSGGQRQRIAIARAIVRGSPVLVLDEPSTGLDEQSRVQIRRAIDDLREERIVLVIAHDEDAVRDVDRVVTIDQGKLIADSALEPEKRDDLTGQRSPGTDPGGKMDDAVKS